MPVSRPPRLRLFDILESVQQIEMASSQISVEQLRTDQLRYRAIERWLEIISEASRHIDDSLKAQFPEVPWRQVGDFGNVVRHGYESVSAQIVWNIIQRDLPILKNAAAKLYAALKLPADPWPDPGQK